MARTNAGKVQQVLGGDYDQEKGPTLDPYIETASAVVDDVVACAAAKVPPVVISVTRQELIERWLAAGYYGVSDKPYGSRSTAGASGAFHGVTGKYGEFNGYLMQAQRLDPSGCLTAILAPVRATASAGWLGRVPSEQTPYADRR